MRYKKNPTILLKCGTDNLRMQVNKTFKIKRETNVTLRGP